MGLPYNSTKVATKFVENHDYADSEGNPQGIYTGFLYKTPMGYY